MARCHYTETCPFFTSKVGYSPGLFESMRDRFCLGDESGCARLHAIEIIGRENVPVDMLPTDVEMLERLTAEADCCPSEGTGKGDDE